MRKIIKYIISCLCFTMLFMCGVACGGKGGDEQQSKYTGFVQGYLKRVEIGRSLVLAEYVDYIEDEEFTLIAQQGSTTVDLSKRKTWDTSNPGLTGDWELVYTVMGGDFKGEYKAVINVYAPMLTFDYTVTSEALTYELGSTMDYQKFFNSLYILEKSYYPCTRTMRSVRINGVETDLTGTTNFTFTQKATHYFKFTVDSEDGQSSMAIVNVFVIETADEAVEWMNANGVTVYGYNEFSSDLGVSFNAGWTKNSDSQSDLSYLAYHGKYGVGDYVQFDFTGNNLPQLVFFSDNIVNAIVDGSKGLLVSNGVLYSTGAQRSTLSSRITVYGPNKVSSRSFITSSKDALVGDGIPGEPNALAKLGLVDGTKYRYIAGFAEGKTQSESILTDDQVRADAEYIKLVGRINKDLTDEEKAAEEQRIFNEIKTAREAGSALFRALLINLDTQEIVLDLSLPVGFTYDRVTSGRSFPDGYFSGNIIAYGNFGIQTKIDKVYSVFEDMESIYDVDGCAQYLDKAPKFASVGTTFSVSDYVEEVKTDDVFGYVKAEDAKYDDLFTVVDGKLTINTASQAFHLIVGDSFTFNEQGDYVLYYQDSATKRPAGLRLRIGNDVLSENFDNGVNDSRSDLFAIYGLGRVDYIQTIAADESGNGKHLEIHLPKYTGVVYRININQAYIDNLLTMPDVTHFVFDIKASKSCGVETMKTIYVNTDWQTVMFSKKDCADWFAARNAYQLMVDSTKYTADEAVVLYIDNLRALKIKTAYLTAEKSDFQIDFNKTATNVKINGESVAFTQNNNTISISQDCLQTYLGVNGLEIFVGETAYYYQLEVVGTNVGFEDGKMSSVVGSGSMIGVMNDASYYYASLSVAEGNGVGAYALCAVVTRRMALIDISYSYMQYVFAAEQAKYLEFKMYVPEGSIKYVAKQYQIKNIEEDNCSTWNEEGMHFAWSENDNCYVVRVDRTAYQAWSNNAYVTEHKGVFVLRLYMQDTAEIEKTFGTFYLDDFHIVYGMNVYVSENATGTYTMPIQATVEKLYINGAETAFTQIDDGIQMENSALGTLVGENNMQLQTSAGMQYYAFEVITETINFEQGSLQAIGVGGMSSVLDGSYYSKISIVSTSEAAKGNGKYALQSVATRKLTYIDISYEYMQLAFANPDVKYVQFKLYTPEGTLSYVRKQFQTGIDTWTQNKEYIKIEWSSVDECYLVKIGRGAYEKYAQTSYIQENGACFTLGLYANTSVTTLGTYYIDDFEVKSDATIGKNEQA